MNYQRFDFSKRLSGYRLRPVGLALAAARVLSLLAAAAGIGMVASEDFAFAQSQDSGEVEVLHVRGPIYMITAGGVNVTASIGPDGVLLVDTGPTELSEKIMASIRDIQKQLAFSRSLVPPPVGGAETRSATQTAMYASPRLTGPVRFILQTNGHRDHNGGNAKMAIQIPKELSSQDPGEIATHVFAHENVLQRVSGATGDRPALPFEFWPSDTYFGRYYKLTSFFNGEGVQLIHIPKANTDGDSFVWFRGSDVISAGDIYRTDSFPVPELGMGGNIQGVVEGLNQLLDMAIPEYRQEGGTLIIPGHGRLSDSGDIAAYRDMVTIIRDRVQRLIKDGRTLDQVKAARPDLDYAGRYAKEPGAAGKFVEAVYRSLIQGNTKE